MSRTTGKYLEGLDHAEQRLIDVLTTSKVSRVMNREYGAGLMDLVDKNVNESWVVQANAAVAEAINNPVNGLSDLRLVRVVLEKFTDSNIEVNVEADYLPTQERVLFNGINISA